MAGKKGMRDKLVTSPAGIAAFRAKIKAAELRNALENHALKGIEMSATQIKAAEILLRKCAPDLSAVDTTMHGETVLNLTFGRRESAERK